MGYEYYCYEQFDESEYDACIFTYKQIFNFLYELVYLQEPNYLKEAHIFHYFEYSEGLRGQLESAHLISVNKIEDGEGDAAQKIWSEPRFQVLNSDSPLYVDLSAHLDIASKEVEADFYKEP